VTRVVTDFFLDRSIFFRVARFFPEEIGRSPSMREKMGNTKKILRSRKKSVTIQVANIAFYS
jgi:hypothetical protein